jgi:hypothetical protein
MILQEARDVNREHHDRDAQKREQGNAFSAVHHEIPLDI